MFQYQMLPSGDKTREGSNLVLRNVSRLDSGTFICRASNGVERPVEARIDLQVICEFESYCIPFPTHYAKYAFFYTQMSPRSRLTSLGFTPTSGSRLSCLA